MKIKLALLSGDTNYLSRITAAFTSKYADKLEVCSFSDPGVAMAALAEQRSSVFISDDCFEIDESRLPRRCGLAYLVESPDIESFNGKPAVCKYQKVEMIYKTILQVFSDTVSDSIGIRPDADSAVRFVTFVSAASGAGASVSAAACAKSFAQAGQRTLFLNFETLGVLDPFFSGPGHADFGDVIFAVLAKKTNLSLRLESCVRQDASGVFFFAPPKTALDMNAIKAEDIQRLITDLKFTGTYDNIVIDCSFSLCEKMLELFRQSTSIVFVLDGGVLSSAKFRRAYQAMDILDRQYDRALLPKLCVFYNRFANAEGQTLGDDIRSIGWAPWYERASEQQVVAQLSGLGIFQTLQ